MKSPSGSASWDRTTLNSFVVPVLLGESERIARWALHETSGGRENGENRGVSRVLNKVVFPNPNRGDRGVTTTEEIIVSGEDFIERRILVLPEPEEIEDLEEHAYEEGYKSGWVRGLVVGLGVLVLAVACIWLANW